MTNLPPEHAASAVNKRFSCAWEYCCDDVMGIAEMFGTNKHHRSSIYTPHAAQRKAVCRGAQMAGAGFGTYLLVALIVWGSMAPILKAAKNEAFGAYQSAFWYFSTI